MAKMIVMQVVFVAAVIVMWMASRKADKKKEGEGEQRKKDS